MCPMWLAQVTRCFANAFIYYILYMLVPLCMCGGSERAHAHIHSASLSFFTEFRFIILTHLIFGTIVRRFVIFFSLVPAFFMPSASSHSSFSISLAFVSSIAFALILRVLVLISSHHVLPSLLLGLLAV